MDPMTKTPAALAYRMPAEWEPHAATWLSWPRREGISFPESFDRVLPVLRTMTEALSASEQVCINVGDQVQEAEARAVLNGLPMESISFHGITTRGETNIHRSILTKWSRHASQKSSSCRFFIRA